MGISQLFEGPPAGHVHGIITVLSLALLVGAIWRFASTPNRYRVAAGVVLGLAAMFAGGIVTFHTCDKGQPVLYVIYAGGSVAALTIFCGRKAATVILSVVLFAVFLGMARDYARLVHAKGFIGDPNTPESDYPKGPILNLIAARDFAANCDSAAPEGFLSDAAKSGAWTPGPGTEDPRFAFVKDDFEFERARVRWYTYVTGLWGLETRRYGVWTPGGRLSGVAADIELRERR